MHGYVNEPEGVLFYLPQKVEETMSKSNVYWHGSKFALAAEKQAYFNELLPDETFAIFFAETWKLIEAYKQDCPLPKTQPALTA